MLFPRSLLWTSNEFLGFMQESTQPKPYKTPHRDHSHRVSKGSKLYTVLQTLGKSLNFWNSCLCIGNADGFYCTLWNFFIGPIVPWFWSSLIYFFATACLAPWKSLSLTSTLCFRECHFPSIFKSITTLQ